MTDNNEELIRNFMASGKTDIPDDGFTERVMNRLPDSLVWANRILNIVCTAACIFLFIVSDGFNLFKIACVNLIQAIDLLALFQSQQWYIWTIILVVMAGMGVQRLHDERVDLWS